MLDCHIILHPSRNPTRCIASVREAIGKAGFPVSLHFPQFIPGHIGKSRAIGYAMGSARYVTCVDDDDWLEPDAFSCLAEAMATDAPAIYTREFQHINGSVRQRDMRQHLRVFRRDVVDSFDFSQWPAFDSTALIAHADTFGRVVELPNRVYHYTVKANSDARRIGRKVPSVARKAWLLGNVHEASHG